MSLLTQLIARTPAAGAPAPGTNPLTIDTVAEGSYAGVRTFEALPLSAKTKRGLDAASYTTLTAIQRAALPHALCGRDVLGAAKTGSGKTLSFLIPLVERLYRCAKGGWGVPPRGSAQWPCPCPS